MYEDHQAAKLVMILIQLFPSIKTKTLDKCYTRIKGAEATCVEIANEMKK